MFTTCCPISEAVSLAQTPDSSYRNKPLAQLRQIGRVLLDLFEDNARLGPERGRITLG
jgi:hypothetical protein